MDTCLHDHIAAFEVIYCFRRTRITSTADWSQLAFARFNRYNTSTRAGRAVVFNLNHSAQYARWHWIVARFTAVLLGRRVIDVATTSVLACMLLLLLEMSRQ